MESFYESMRETIDYIEFQYRPTMCEPHWHQAVEILCALNDDVYTLVNSKERILHAGEICVADSYDVHSFNSNKNNVMILIIPTEYLNDYFKLKGKRHLGSPYVTSPEVCKKIRDAIKEFENSSLPVLLQRGYVNVVLGILCEQCGLIEFYDADVYLMKDILNYLEENYQEEVDLNSLSKKFGYSKYYFSRMFNRFFRFSLNEYLSRLRIRRFISKMATEKNPDIISTAFDCGFSSWQTFYRCFKKFYGISPKKYLTNMKKNSRSLK